MFLFNFRQAFLAFRQNDVHGQFVALGWDADDFDHLVFVVLEYTAFLHDRHKLDFVAVQRLEDALFGLVVSELLSPLGFQLQSADDQHLGVIGDAILRHQTRHLVLRLGRYPLVDLLAALLRLALEVAFAHFHAQTSLNGLDELLLHGGRLRQENAGDRFDLSALTTDAALLSPLISGQEGVLDVLNVQRLLTTFLQQLMQGIETLDGLARSSDFAGDSDFLFRVASGSNVQGSQSQEDGSGRDDGVLVVAFAFGLGVEGGGQFAVHVLQLGQVTRVWTALSST